MERLCYTGERGMGALEFAPPMLPRARRTQRIQIDKLVALAAEAGIVMSECRLFEEQGRRHFMTRRFDRIGDGEKLHMLSLCGLAHYDFNSAGAHACEQALMIVRQLELSMRAIEQQFRRMTFNILARNQDDHAKNIAFLMDKSGRWSLAPAFDVTYSYNPAGAWSATHQMTVNGKRDGFTLEDFKDCAKAASMKRGHAERIVDEVRRAVGRWPVHAQAAGVTAAMQEGIQRNLRSDALR